MDKKLIRNIISICIVLLSFPVSDLVRESMNEFKGSNIGKDDIRYAKYIRSGIFTVLVRIIIIILAISIAIHISDVSSVYFFTSLGVMSLVLPVALQQPIQDYFAGFLLVIFDKVRKGDFIVTYSTNNNNNKHHTTGTIQEIKTFTTQVRHPGSDVISEVANSVLWTQSIDIKNRVDNTIELQLLLSHDNEIVSVENMIKSILFDRIEVSDIDISHEHSDVGMRIIISTGIEVKDGSYYELKQKLYRDLKIGLQAQNIKFVN